MKILNKKERSKKIIFLTGICLLSSYFIFLKSMAMGHDTSFHMYRLQGIISSFQDGQILPKIYPYTNNGFGYATPLFYCEVFLYPFAILYRLGVPLIISYKLMRCFYICVSILSIFITTKKIFENKKSAPYIATLLYTYCNYHLYDIYLRDAFGEYLALACIPLIILSIYKVFEKKENSWIFMGVSFAILLCSHLLSFAMVCVVFFIYIIFYCIMNHSDVNLLKSRFFVVLKAVLLASALSAFFLAPMLEQMASQKFLVNYYGEFFDVSKSATAVDMLFKPFINFSNYTSNGPYCTFNLGYIFYFGQFIYLYHLIKGNGTSNLTFSFIISNICILFSIGLAPTFGIFSNINVIQFSFRFNIVSFVLLTYVITYSIIQLKNPKIKNFFIIIVVLYSCLNMLLIFYYDRISIEHCYNNQTYDEAFSIYTKSDSYDRFEISGGEYLPANDLYQYKYEDANYIKIVEEDRYNYYLACNRVDGKDVPIEYERNGSHIYFTYTSEYDTLMMLPLTYYKGYSVYAIDSDGNAERLGYEDIGRYKQVAFRNKVGTYDYYCYYEGTTIQKVSLYISTVTAIATVVVCVIKAKHRAV